MVRQPVHGGMSISLRRTPCGPVQRDRSVTAEDTTQYLNPQGEPSVRKRLIVTGTTAAFVLTAGIMGAVAVQPPGPDKDRDTTAAPAVPDALYGLPPMMVKREATSNQGENGTVDVPKHSAVDVELTPAAGQYPLKCSHMLHSTFGMKGSILVR